jgi:hypothetical protein
LAYSLVAHWLLSVSISSGNDNPLIDTMRAAPEITTQWINRSDERTPPKSELLLDGTATGKYISGAVLQAAIQWRSFYLLFMTNNDLFEDWLDIGLVDKDMNRLDSAVIGGPYTNGIFSQISFVSPDSVQFYFFKDRAWTVKLLPRPSLRIPWVLEPIGVWRSFNFSRHFIIRSNPQPMERHV